MTNKSTSLTRRLIPGLIFGFVVVLGLILLGDLRNVAEVLLSFQWQYFAIALGFTLVNYILRFFKWHFYLAQIGVRDLTLLESARLFVAGFPLAVTPGKVGEALKGVWLNKKSGVPIARGVSVVLAERISDGLAVLVLSTLGVVAYPQYALAFILILVSLLAVIVLSQIRPAAYFLLGLGEKMPLINRFVHNLREFYEGSFAVFRPWAVIVAVSLGTISWLGEGIGLYYILLGLGMQPGWSLLAEAVFILSFSTVIGAASALPGGLGASEASIAGMLAFILAAPAALATSATLLIRLATLWFGVALGLVVWLFSADLLGLSEANKAVDDPA